MLPHGQYVDGLLVTGRQFHGKYGPIWTMPRPFQLPPLNRPERKEPNAANKIIIRHLQDAADEEGLYWC